MKVPDKNNLAVQNTGESALSVDIPEELKHMFDLSDNMEGVTPRLPQINIAHTVQMFKMPDDSKIEEFEGIIIGQHPANAWWEKDMSESGGGALPDCYSMDAVVSEEKSENRQCEFCSECDQNKFGSDPKTGKGKACKNMKRMHIVLEGSLLPHRLTVPPTSISVFELYMTRITDRGLPFAAVVTKFELSKKEFEGFEFSELKMSVVRVLNREELVIIADFIKQYRDVAKKQEIQKDEYQTEENTTEDAQSGYMDNEPPPPNDNANPFEQQPDDNDIPF